MRLPRPEHSFVVLVGVSEYQSDALANLPTIRNNVHDLAATLTDSTLGSIPPANCLKILNPTSSRAISERLLECSNEATDTLIFYFAGHGLPSMGRNPELFLGLPNTDPTNPWFSTIRYSSLRELLLSQGRFPATNKTVILDCCFAGSALPSMSVSQVGELTDIGGVCILTATSGKEQAFAPTGERYTAFTGQLIATMRRGIVGGPEFISVLALYQEARRGLEARGLSPPGQHNTANATELGLVRNIAYDPARVTDDDAPIERVHTRLSFHRHNVVFKGAHEGYYEVGRIYTELKEVFIAAVDQILHRKPTGELKREFTNARMMAEQLFRTTGDRRWLIVGDNIRDLWIQQMKVEFGTQNPLVYVTGTTWTVSLDQVALYDEHARLVRAQILRLLRETGS